MIVYPLDRLYREVAYVAYHLHWPHDQIMGMEHLERQRWVDEVAAINAELDGQGGGAQ